MFPVGSCIFQFNLALPFAHGLVERTPYFIFGVVLLVFAECMP